MHVSLVSLQRYEVAYVTFVLLVCDNNDMAAGRTQSQVVMYGRVQRRDSQLHW